MSKKNYHIVIGLGFGDEGKGKTVDYLCEKLDADLVVRYNGGAQAAHTVQRNGIRHTFRQFGSGALLGVQSYYSAYCSFCPVTAYEEAKALEQLGAFEEFVPTLWVDPRCPVITPFQMMYNRCTEDLLKHGSCGMGIWENLLLSKEDPSLTIFARDLFLEDSSILQSKLEAQAKHYNWKLKEFKTSMGIQPSHIADVKFSPLNVFDEIKAFKWFARQLHLMNNEVDGMVKLASLDPNSNPLTLKFAETVVFEGAQGHLLSAEYFDVTEHVTAYDINLENALNLCCKDLGTDPEGVVEIYGVMRSYMSRHGNGPLPLEHETPIENSDIGNPKNAYQGAIRTGPWSTSLLSMIDIHLSKHSSFGINHLVVNHLDQSPILASIDSCKWFEPEHYLKGNWNANTPEEVQPRQFLNQVSKKHVLGHSLKTLILGYSPEAKDMKTMKAI
jgi:adenylosuccinate synthase